MCYVPAVVVWRKTISPHDGGMDNEGILFIYLIPEMISNSVNTITRV